MTMVTPIITARWRTPQRDGVYLPSPACRLLLLLLLLLLLTVAAAVADL